MSEATSKLGILVGVDGSAESEVAIRWAAYEAVLRDLPLTLMHVIAPVVVSWPVASLQASFDESQQNNARDVIEQAQKIVLASAGESGPPVVRTEVRRAGVAPTLVSASKDAFMVVVGSRGLGAIGRALLGSVSASLVRHARCAVAVMRGDDAHVSDSTAPVLLGIDGSPASEAATAFAFEEASRRGVDLVTLHAWSDVTMFPGMDWRLLEDQSQQILEERLAGWRERYPDVQVRRRIVADRPAAFLIEESQHVQLVVVGSRGRGGFAGMLLGSVSSAVAQEAKAPVVVVRS
jgi:nucleotide-binding universal stress UspA family protein